MGPRVDLAFFLELANSALGGPAVPDRADTRAIHEAAETLRSTCFWVEGNADLTLSTYETWGLSVRQILSQLARAKVGDRVDANLPVLALHEALVSPDGLIRLETQQPDGSWYYRFLASIEDLDARHLHECPECQRLYWARTDKGVCSGKCRVARFRRKQPDRWKEIRDRHERERGVQDAIRKRELDRKERQRLATVRPGPQRPPKGSARKLSARSG